MSHLAEFETSLKEVVNAKRLSASKMNNLTDLAMKSMADDTQLVSIMYRTHKTLTPSAKISSLYVFDALARAARSQVVKQGLTGDINSQPGNSATFLLKLEGILEGLFQDMISTGTSEGKEKTKKVLDIWVKGSTFPLLILARLKDVAAEKGAYLLRAVHDDEYPNNPLCFLRPVFLSLVTESTSGFVLVNNQVKVTLDPRAAAVAVAAPPPQTPAQTVPPPPPATDAQATLLALLTQAAANNAVQTNLGQTTPNTTGSVPQLSLLQQLTANLTHPPHQVQQQQPHPPPHPPAQDNFHGRRHDPRSEHQQQRNHNGYEGRGNFRGGSRGRGRGEGRNSDNRDRFHKEEGRRQGRSRSESPPPRGGDRPSARPYSPPRRPSERVAQPPQAGLDEFGREIRPASPSPEPPDDIVDEQAAAANQNQPPQLVTSSVRAANNHESQMSFVDVNTSSRLPVNAAQPATLENPADLSNFDASTFDFTSPASWEAMGRMWQASFGTAPTMEQLMQYVMTGGVMPGTTTMTGQQQVQPQPQPIQTYQQQQPDKWGGHQQQGFRGSRGRGGFSRGRGGGGHNGGAWHDSDAIVLGDTNVSSEAGSTAGGKMQRVGEKWVFGRD
ncbi:CID domain-containing protein [Mycena indigotica]|uniref:CID domain-containing protein n=1 Tax=Mycena indigotica TaxID=2126181 RepID=A0A8H6WK11_9AGAR|nr:CID domain-containing protein [Mycena indigotica]KAF7315204.1 CID domain-containing protein [Mycena indigotica]